MTERDEFDRIVEGLSFDVEAIERAEAVAVPQPITPAPRDDEEFYRRVPPARLRPTRRTALVWLGVMLAPVALVLSALLRWPVSMPVVILVTTVSGASAIALVWRLPEHGPAQQDWPDDGAAL